MAALSTNLTWDLAKTRWPSQLNPFLFNPLNQVAILENVSLQAGVNVLNHMLGQNMQGWFLVDVQGIATIYRSQPFNDQTLTLTVSAPVTVSIGVF